MNTNPYRIGRAFLVSLLLLAPLASGCNSSDRPYPVSGQLVFDDGKPAVELAGGTIVFTSNEMQVSASGEITDEGKFALTTVKKNDGVRAGRYRVVIMPPEPESGGDAARPRRGPRFSLDARYQDPEQTPLEAVVEPKSNDLTLTLERTGKSRKS